MTEFWEASFREKQTMWGFEPADSAIRTAAFFSKQKLSKILIPGFGYGRNAKVFFDKGCEVTGIEISETAIALAEKHFGDKVKVHRGSVSAMPFDKELYDGIFCYALLHLLAEEDRARLLEACYQQLKPAGYMVFVTLSTADAAYGAGEKLGYNRFRTRHGVELFFYDAASIEKEFGQFGLLEANAVTEPAKNIKAKPVQKFWEIICRKEEK